MKTGGNLLGGKIPSITLHPYLPQKDTLRCNLPVVRLSTAWYHIRYINPNTLLWYYGINTIVPESWLNFFASHCNTALAICIALLNKLFAGLLWPRLITSALGLMHLTLPMIQSLKNCALGLLAAFKRSRLINDLPSWGYKYLCCWRVNNECEL